MSKTDAAVAWIRNIAADDSHGYQWGGWGPQDYDCGHLVIMAWQNAGVPVRDAGASWTGNMKRTFLACGFKDITSQVNLKTGAGMRPGDVLLNEANHAAMVTSSGKIVQARSNLDGKSGDSSGQEIREQNYYNYPWDCVLRYDGDDSGDGGGGEIPVHDPDYTLGLYVLSYGSGWGDKEYQREAVRSLQRNLKDLGFDIGTCGLDGQYGYSTQNAVAQYQRSVGLNPDGIAGHDTMAALLGVSAS